MLKRLLLNTSSNLLLMFVKLVITFIMTPIFVSNLGKYDYGLWEMIGGVIGYMGILDLGIRPAISRYAAKYQAEEDAPNLNIVFSSSLCFMIAVGSILMTTFVLWGIWFPDTLAPEGETGQRYTILLLILGAQLLITFPGYVAESYLEGFQKYYLKNNITLINSIIGGVLLYNYMTPETGILLLAGVNAVGISIKFILYFVVLAAPVNGGIRFHFSNFSLAKLREMLSFSFKSLIQGIATRVETATDTLIIGFVLGPSVVPFYSIPANLVQYLRVLGWTLTHAFMPLFSGLSAKSEDETMRQVYLLASKYVAGVIFPMACGIAVLGGPFLSVWIGPEFQAQGELIIYLLVFFTVFPFLDPFVSRYLTAIGKHGILARLMPVAALINILLSLLFVKPFGIVGVAAASAIPVSVFVPMYLRYVCKNLGISMALYLKSSILPCAVPTLILSGVVLFLRWQWGMDSYLEIFSSVVISGLVWAVAFWMIAMSSVERQQLVSLVSKRLRKSVR